MRYFLLAPFVLQAIAIGFDEVHFHLKRGLPFWERVGHPVDTLSFLICLLFILWMPFSEGLLKVYIGLSLFSCLMVTKDEFVHTNHCEGTENWLHALLFLLHPLALISAGLFWPMLHGQEGVSWMKELECERDFFEMVLRVQSGAIFLFGLYQVIFWNFVWKGEVYDKQRVL